MNTRAWQCGEAQDNGYPWLLFLVDTSLWWRHGFRCADLNCNLSSVQCSGVPGMASCVQISSGMSPLCSALVYKAGLYSCMGLVMGMLGTAIVQGLTSVREKVGPTPAEWAPSNSIQPHTIPSSPLQLLAVSPSLPQAHTPRHRKMR